MTSHYIDLDVIPDPETSAPQLMGALHDKLHVALVTQKRRDIGVSFPGYAVNPRAIGRKLRLHGSEAALKQLMQADWLKGVRDHVRITDVESAPADAHHRIITRKQFKTNANRLRRRRMRRKDETAEQATQAIPATVERRPTLPYVHLHSWSTKQAFCLFIRMGKLVERAQPGDFNSYGLSGSATIPWF